MKKKIKLKRKYPVIKKGKNWWKSLERKDRKIFIDGFKKNKRAEEIQKKETEFNRAKIKSRLMLSIPG